MRCASILRASDASETYNQVEDRTVRTTYQYHPKPTPDPERVVEDVWWRCRTLYTTALEPRLTAWTRCRLTLTRYQQEAELKDLRTQMPDSGAVHSQVLQDVLARLDKT